MPARSITAKHANSWAKVYISKHHAIKARYLLGASPKSVTGASDLLRRRVRSDEIFSGEMLPCCNERNRTAVTGVLCRGKTAIDCMYSERCVGPPSHRDTPGPGTYLPGLPASEANVRFGTSVRKDIDYATPSPGPVYDIRTSVSDSRFPKVLISIDSHGLSGEASRI